MKKSPIAALVTAAALLLALIPGQAALAEEPDMQQRIDAVLATNPSGTQIAWNEISWNKGDIVLTLAPNSTSGAAALAAVGGCTSGSFCAYSLGNYAGNKLTFSTCVNIHSVSALGSPVRSIANSRTSGSIRAYSSTNLLATAAAGTGANVSGTTTYISCS